MLHEAQPCLLEKVLGDVTTPGQTSQKREQAAIELGVYDVECVCLAGAETSDERELGFAVHGDLLYRSHVEGFSPVWREASGRFLPTQPTRGTGTSVPCE